MKKVTTVFLIDGQTYAVNDLTGQDAANAVLSSFPHAVVKLHGFVIDDKFKPADLTSHWDRSKTMKGLVIN